MSRVTTVLPGVLPGIRRARKEEREEISRLLGEAFMADPVSGWVFPDEEHRRTVHPRFFGVFLDAALRDGWVDVLEDHSAAALWLPVMVGETAGAGAGHGEDDGHDEMTEALAAADPGNERTRIVGELTALAHPMDRSHYYLPNIVAAPGRTGGGRGSALLKAVLERCDREGMPAYLEASNARSKALYERHGFVFTGRTVDLPGGPPMWPMWREPRG
ncbi:GNAT family N-acetyltransferase [Streptomyces netropsis]|uniref:GNAT superfamily N-acetyltransferase n=1 Tax=Streptomyces netropsis TaxID=55404 RepID=A0A7W7PD44_STRNE|nr:GNAT family N-acetyltransferase [Streptomyces netropsis]MBB4886401.1 GNAT superfamily N-acetyltransferase [Streptomyces netropsis]GGR19957.1 N-acetyltransferase [Streptomyces netropsis]